MTPAAHPLSHLDARGKVRTVDVGEKPVTARSATASGRFILGTELYRALEARDFHSAKGPLAQTATLAAIMGAKQTPALIPLCHPIALDAVDIDVQPAPPDALHITARCRARGSTGVEMEALTAVSIAALTLYDMCKSASLDLRIEGIRLDSKHGGKRSFDRAEAGGAGSAEVGPEDPR